MLDLNMAKRSMSPSELLDQLLHLRHVQIVPTHATYDILLLLRLQIKERLDKIAVDKVVCGRSPFFVGEFPPAAKRRSATSVTVLPQSRPVRYKHTSHGQSCRWC